MTVSRDWSMHLVRKSGGSPEQQIAASLIVTAREGCVTGNAEDCQWLESCGVAYLTLICPNDVDEQLIMEKLLAGLPTPKPSGGWRQNAANFIQLVLDLAMPASGTEAHRGDATHLPSLRTRTRDPTRRDFQRPLAPALPGVPATT